MAHGFFQVHNWIGVVFAQFKAKKLPLQRRNFPRGVYVFIRQLCEFRHPLPDEVAVRIMFAGIEYRIINPDGVNSSSAGLHLKLRVVDAGLKIQKLPGQMVRPCLPGLPERVRKEGNQHGPHPEVDVAGGVHTAHRSIYQREARLSGLPGFYLGSIRFGTQVIEGGVEIFKLNTALAFKFLNKVVAPAQAGQEVIEVAFVRHQMPVLPAVLISLPEADVAPGQIG